MTVRAVSPGDGERGAETVFGTRRVVLFTCLHGSVAGSSRSLTTVLAHLPREFSRVVAAPPGPLADFVRGRGLADDLVRLPAPGRHRTSSRVLASMHLARWMIARRESLLAVHANGLADLGLVWPGALLVGVPVVVWSHKPGRIAPRTRRGAMVGGRLLPRLRWVAASDVARETLVDGGLARSDDVVVVENPIDTADVVAARWADDRVCVGFLGDASHRKGFQFLADIVTRVNDPSIRWRIFARPRATGELRGIWERLRGNPAVELVGREVDVRRAYARCDIVVCPSLSESFCRVAAEAMANGIPVVASDLPALRNVVGDGKCGLLFPAGDVDAAAEAIGTLVRDPELRIRLGARGRIEARSYDPATIAATFADLYAGMRAGVVQ